MSVSLNAIIQRHIISVLIQTQYSWPDPTRLTDYSWCESRKTFKVVFVFKKQTTNDVLLGNHGTNHYYYYFFNFHCNCHLYCRHRHLLFTYHYGIINAPHSCPVFLTAYQSYALRPSRSSIALTMSLFWATSHDSDSTSDHKVLYNSYHIGLHGPTDEKSLSNCAELALMHSTLQSVAVFADMRE